MPGDNARPPQPVTNKHKVAVTINDIQGFRPIFNLEDMNIPEIISTINLRSVAFCLSIHPSILAVEFLKKVG